MDHPIVSREEWTAASKALLVKEKQLTRLRDQVNAERRALPWVKVEKAYAFDTTEGRKTLAELFEGRSQLIVYHFMWRWDLGLGCDGCSFHCDHVDGANLHLSHHDVTFVAVSRGHLADLQTYRKRMGWRFRLASSYGSDFNYDYHVSFTPEERGSGNVYYNYTVDEFPAEEGPGLSVFAKDAAGDVFHTYSTFARGLDILVGTYNFLDFVPKGRDEDGLSFSMAWVRHHDKYEQGYQTDAALTPNQLFEKYQQQKSTTGSCCSSESHS